MKKFLLHKLTTLLVLTLVFTACSDNDPEVVNEEELITTVNITLTPQGGGNTVNLQFRDPDGPDGPLTPTATPPVGILQANTVYDGTIEFLDETKTPAEDITEEIEEEDEEHQIFYSFDTINATVEYTDQDSNGNPVGLNFRVTTTTAASGVFRITLLHEPDKSAPGVSTGDPTNAGGETDIFVTLLVEVQ